MRNICKNIMVLFLCTIFALTGCNTEYEKNDAMTGNNKVNISMSNATATSGEQVVIPVQIVENTGLYGMNLKITYDNTLLDFESVEVLEQFADYSYVTECTEIPKSNIVRVSYVFTEEFIEVGEFIQLIFFVVPEGKVGEIAAVNVEIQEVFRIDDKKVTGNEKCIGVEILEKQNREWQE